MVLDGGRPVLGVRVEGVEEVVLDPEGAGERASALAFAWLGVGWVVQCSSDGAEGMAILTW